jgi:hypothetical protein
VHDIKRDIGDIKRICINGNILNQDSEYKEAVVNEVMNFRVP